MHATCARRRYADNSVFKKYALCGAPRFFWDQCVLCPDKRTCFLLATHEFYEWLCAKGLLLTSDNLVHVLLERKRKRKNSVEFVPETNEEKEAYLDDLIK